MSSVITCPKSPDVEMKFPVATSPEDYPKIAEFVIGKLAGIPTMNDLIPDIELAGKVALADCYKRFRETYKKLLQKDILLARVRTAARALTKSHYPLARLLIPLKFGVRGCGESTNSVSVNLMRCGVPNIEIYVQNPSTGEIHALNLVGVTEAEITTLIPKQEDFTISQIGKGYLIDSYFRHHCPVTAYSDSPIEKYVKVFGLTQVGFRCVSVLSKEMLDDLDKDVNEVYQEIKPFNVTLPGKTLAQLAFLDEIHQQESERVLAFLSERFPDIKWKSKVKNDSLNIWGSGKKEGLETVKDALLKFKPKLSKIKDVEEYCLILTDPNPDLLPPIPSSQSIDVLQTNDHRTAPFVAENPTWSVLRIQGAFLACTKYLKALVKGEGNSLNSSLSLVSSISPKAEKMD